MQACLLLVGVLVAACSSGDAVFATDGSVGSVPDASPDNSGPGGSSGSAGSSGFTWQDAATETLDQVDAQDESVAPDATDAATEPATCGLYTGLPNFTCAPDGMGRGKCDSAGLTFEPCSRGCLIKPRGTDDVCLGTTHTWSCAGAAGTSKLEDGDYYATAFGCWTDENSVLHPDPAGNCIPACLPQAQAGGLCASMTGPQCEESVNWYAAGFDRFGCLARLRVENPNNGKAASVVVLDSGPACWVEQSVTHGIVGLPAVPHSRPVRARATPRAARRDGRRHAVGWPRVAGIPIALRLSP